MHKSEIPEDLRVELRKQAEKTVAPNERKPEPEKDAQRSSSAFNFSLPGFGLEEKPDEKDFECLDRAEPGEFEWSWIKEGERVKAQVPSFEPLEDEATNTKTHAYVCSITLRDTSWEVRKRFSQFEKLGSDLEEVDADGCSDMIFPSKSLLTFGILGDDGLEQRRKDLDKFMRAVVSRIDLLTLAAQAVVWHFLSVHRYFGKQTAVKQVLAAVKEREALGADEMQAQTIDGDDILVSGRKETMFDSLGSLFDSGSAEQQQGEDRSHSPVKADDGGGILGSFLSRDSPPITEGSKVAAVRKDSMFDTGLQAFGDLFTEAPPGAVTEESMFNSFLSTTKDADVAATQAAETRAGGGGLDEASRNGSSEQRGSEARTAQGSALPAGLDKSSTTAAAGGSPRTAGQQPSGVNETTSVAGEGDTSERTRVCTHCFARVYERPILRYGAHFKEAAACWLAIAMSVWTDYVDFARVAQRGLQPLLESQKQRLLKLQRQYILLAVRRFAPHREQAVAVVLFEALDLWKATTFTHEQLQKLHQRPMDIGEAILPESSTGSSMTSYFSGPSLGFQSPAMSAERSLPAPPTLTLSVQGVENGGAGDGGGDGAGEENVPAQRRRTAADPGNNKYERASAILAYRNLVRRSKSMTAVEAGGDFHQMVQNSLTQRAEDGAAAAGEGNGADVQLGDLVLPPGDAGGGTERKVSGSAESAMMTKRSDSVSSLTEVSYPLDLSTNRHASFILWSLHTPPHQT
jgi:hypothetical protein